MCKSAIISEYLKTIVNSISPLKQRGADILIYIVISQWIKLNQLETLRRQKPLVIVKCGFHH